MYKFTYFCIIFILFTDCYLIYTLRGVMDTQLNKAKFNMFVNFNWIAWVYVDNDDQAVMLPPKLLRFVKLKFGGSHNYNWIAIGEQSNISSDDLFLLDGRCGQRSTCWGHAAEASYGGLKVENLEILQKIVYYISHNILVIS